MVEGLQRWSSSHAAVHQEHSVSGSHLCSCSGYWSPRQHSTLASKDALFLKATSAANITLKGWDISHMFKVAAFLSRAWPRKYTALTTDLQTYQAMAGRPQSWPPMQRGYQAPAVLVRRRVLAYAYSLRGDLNNILSKC